MLLFVSRIKGDVILRIGIFTDTYFPQVSGVATSIKTLRDELIKQGHHVYIFTTTDPHADKVADRYHGIFRFPSVPFVSFPERRIAFSGWVKVLMIARRLHLDLIHNQTEFSLGIMGKMVARELRIPCLHTYHTMYEDYLHYVANGRLIKPRDVATASRAYLKHMTGIVAPSDRVLETLESYQVKVPIRVIPTGINLSVFQHPDTPEQITALRQRYGFTNETPVMLSLSRLAFEKNITGLIDSMPDILDQNPQAQLLIVGDGPARMSLERQVKAMHLTNNIQFTGQVNNDDVHHYYQMADVFVSASDSESQGLTYDEALASDLPIVVMQSEYTDELIDDRAIGISYQKKADLVQGVLYYLARGKNASDIQKRRAKLDSISAEVFGQRIVEFYDECIMRNHNQQLERKQRFLMRKRHD